MKVHLMFSVCEKFHTSRTIPLYETVCKEAEKYHHSFSLIGGFSNVSDDISILRLTDDDTYVSAIDKNLKGILHHYKANTPFDFYMICDDDTFINFNNLNKFIETVSLTKLALYGCKGPICGDGRPHITGGPGILMNRKTFCTIAKTIEVSCQRHHLYSDVTIALNVHKHNEVCKEKDEKIDFVNVEKFLHPHKSLVCINDVITYHISGRNSYYKLYDESVS